MCFPVITHPLPYFVAGEFVCSFQSVFLVERFQIPQVPVQGRLRVFRLDVTLELIHDLTHVHPIPLRFRQGRFFTGHQEMEFLFRLLIVRPQTMAFAFDGDHPLASCSPIPRFRFSASHASSIVYHV